MSSQGEHLPKTSKDNVSGWLNRSNTNKDKVSGWEKRSKTSKDKEGGWIGDKIKGRIYCKWMGHKIKDKQ